MRLTSERLMSVRQHISPPQRALGVLLLAVLLLAGCGRSEASPPTSLPAAGEPQVIVTTLEATAVVEEVADGVAEVAVEDAAKDENAAPPPQADEVPAATTIAAEPASESAGSAAGATAEDAAQGDADAAGAAQEGSNVATETSPSTDEEAPATPDVTSGRVVLWHAYAGADGDALEAILADLRRQEPGLVVETLFVGYEDLPQAYADAVLAGGGPDLIAAPTWWLTQMVDAGVVQALDELVEPGLVEAYYPATMEALTRNGALYGLPLTYELIGLFTNRALAGDGNALTAADLLAGAQRQPGQGAGLYANLFHLAWGLPAFGAELIDDEGVIVLDQGDGATEYVRWLKTLNDTPGAYVNEDYGMLLDRFKKGEFAYFVDGPWAIEELRATLGDDLAVSILPAGPAGPAQPWLSADGVLVNPNKSADQKQRAIRVATGLTDPSAGAHWSQRASRLPANRNAVAADDPLLAGFARQAESAQPIPHAPEMEAVWGYTGDMLLKVLNDVMPPADAVQEAAALINEANGK